MKDPSKEMVEKARYILNHYSRDSLKDQIVLAKELERMIDAAMQPACSDAAETTPERASPTKHHVLEETMDATVWASEFKRISPEADESLMLAWFSTAIMCGYDNGRRKLVKEMCRTAGVLTVADLYQMDKILLD